MTLTLGQVVATEKAERQRANKATGDVHKLAQKPVVMNGLSRTYRPHAEDGQQLPDEGHPVQETVPQLIQRFIQALAPALDAAATKDYANTQARGSVEVDGSVILADVPVSHLLFLEHQLADVRAFVAGLTVLDPAEQWTLNDQTELYEGRPAETIRNLKEEVALVLFPATKEFPAQTKTKIQETPVGTWTNVKLSGAISEVHKRMILARVDKLADAVKVARESANQVAAPRVEVAARLLTYVFG